MRSLYVHSVIGGVCSCYVVFECPFCGMRLGFIMRCLYVLYVGGGVCSCYVVFECPFCDRVRV